MKSITKLALAALVAASGTGVALADNNQYANLLEIQRRAMEREREASATVGVYADRQGVQRQVTAEYAPQNDVRVELRRDSHGGFYFAPAQTR